MDRGIVVIAGGGLLLRLDDSFVERCGAFEGVAEDPLACVGLNVRPEFGTRNEPGRTIIGA